MSTVLILTTLHFAGFVCVVGDDGLRFCSSTPARPNQYEFPIGNVARVETYYDSERGPGWPLVCWSGYQRIRQQGGRSVLTVSPRVMEPC